MRRPILLLAALVIAATLSAGGCGGAVGTAGRGTDDAARTATKIDELAGKVLVSAAKKGPKAYKKYRENDLDLDGVFNSFDNCSTVQNQDQADADGDGFGDACDDAADGDVDGVEDAIDNCPSVVNTSQADLDEDDDGNACDGDMDGDGLANTSDTDMDEDGYESSNDLDNDGDGVTRLTDRFEWDPAYY